MRILLNIVFVPALNKQISQYQNAVVLERLLGTLSNEDGNAKDDGSEKSHFWFALYFLVKVIRVLFLCYKFCDLVLSTTLKKVFSRCNFSDNSVQVLNSVYSKVQLLYLLLVFAVVVDVEVLIA